MFDWLFGSSAKNEQVPRFTPEQQQALSQILSMGLGGLQNNKFDFGPIEDQAREGFQQKTIPGIAERFTALGGGQRSSAFPQILGQAGSGLEKGLAAMKSQYGLQQQNQFQNLLGLGLTPSFENLYHQRQPGFLENAGTQAASMLPYLLMFL